MALISGLTPVWLWRILIFAVGLLLYRGALSLMSAELHFVLSATNQQWRARLTRLLLTLCAAGGLIACAGPMLDPRGPFEMLNSGAASSFVSWFGMLALPSLFPLSGEKNAIAASPVARSIPLILFAAGAGFSYTAILGPGIRFSI